MENNKTVSFIKIYIYIYMFFFSRTILYVSLIYALGNIVVSITAVPSILQAVQL